MIGYLGLGSNVGDRRANLQAAVDALGRHGVRVLASSSLYDTDPVGEVLDQPSFLNACRKGRTVCVIRGGADRSELVFYGDPVAVAYVRKHIDQWKWWK